MKQKITFVICLLFGLMFINAGLNKFFHYMPVPDDLPAALTSMNTALQSIGWVLPLVGLAEIIGGLLMIIPRLRPLGVIILFPILIGILLTHLTVAPSGLPIALGLLLISMWIILTNRDKYYPLIGRGMLAHPTAGKLKKKQAGSHLLQDSESLWNL
ncbi:DoxX family protein [Cesiribacter andamanensis]|uniref:DoxX n=1 Tax=Cesiribacter andamanensis AMV16 TaxID=1279009 RepID=M7N5I0_9BACT|nr:DoxX family protein [Cesiribacter andamanensis]EMR02547.1 DoxX [Cesiribacter andamanensis AMV16]